MSRRRKTLAAVLAAAAALSPASLLAGTVSGTVLTKPTARQKVPPRYYLGPHRSGRGPSVTEEGGPRDVVVFVEGVKGAFPAPARHPQLVQKDERFIPHVLPVQLGSTVDFPNEDDFYHNVFSVVSGDRFDLGRYARGKSAHQTLTKTGVVVVRCEIHSGMKAYILVVPNPFFAVPAADGAFSIPDVPEGTYLVKAWHPDYGYQERSVSVPASGTASVSFAF
jgi:ER membrane protein complex subunit 7-like protein